MTALYSVQPPRLSRICLRHPLLHRLGYLHSSQKARIREKGKAVETTELREPGGLGSDAFEC